MFDRFKRPLSVIAAIALAAPLCIACDDDNDNKSTTTNFETRKVSDTETIQCSPLAPGQDKDLSIQDEKSVIDYLVNICSLSTFFKNSDTYLNSPQKVGSPCFCYGEDCDEAGYERPEQGKIIGCDNVQPIGKAVPICLRSSRLELVKPELYFPNGMCAVAISKCTPLDDSRYICGFAKFGSVYTKDADGRLSADEAVVDEEINKFIEADCPDGTVMAEFEMHISVKIGEERKAKLHVVGCFPGCHSDADCRTGEYDYILQEPGGLHCITADPNPTTQEKAKLCFDERTVAESKISEHGIQTIKAYGFAAE